MVKTLKFILALLCYILIIPICLALTLVATWYILPAFQTTFIGKNILELLTTQEIFIISLSLIGGLILFLILGKLFNTIKSSRVNNFYTHILTWLLALSLVVEALFTFFISNTLSTAAFELTMARKVSIGIGVLLMGLYGLLHKKFGKLIDRKLQAYDTAKELNANGRSSVVWVNLLKVIDFVFPEIILLAVLCFSFNFELSLYFIFIIVSFLIPIIGNMVCDKRVKREAIRKQEEEREVTVNETAEAVAKLINKTGDDQ